MASTRTGELLRPLVTLNPSPPRLPNATKASPGPLPSSTPRPRRCVVAPRPSPASDWAWSSPPPWAPSPPAPTSVGEHGTEPVLVPAMTAVGAAVAWLVAMADLLPDPRRPERRAVRRARDAVAAYAATEPGPDSRPQHHAAPHALADAEETVVEGIWTPSESISTELAAAHREYDARAARASRHIVPGDDPACDPRNPDAGRWLEGDPGPQMWSCRPPPRPTGPSGSSSATTPGAHSARSPSTRAATSRPRTNRRWRQRCGTSTAAPLC